MYKFVAKNLKRKTTDWYKIKEINTQNVQIEYYYVRGVSIVIIGTKYLPGGTWT